MDLLADPELRPLLDQAVDGELDIPVGTGRLRVDLKGDNIRLWQETLDRLQPEGNLLLACETATAASKPHSSPGLWVQQSVLHRSQAAQKRDPF